MTQPKEASAARDACCETTADPRIARHFDRRARESTAKGKLPPLHAVSARLLAALGTPDGNPTLLEVGCGSGALTVDILTRGASHATGIDLSPGSIEAARHRAARAGVVDRARFDVGDGAHVPLEPSDWVVLDRVLCCYHDIDGLLDAAAAAARARLAFTVPISWGWRGAATRLLLRLEAMTAPLRGRPCPGYVHDIGRIEDRLRRLDLRRSRSERVGFWYVAVFDRSPA
jgi:SAM-dependent methyltransferase